MGQGQKRALLAGASGLVGGFLAELLAASGAYSTIYTVNRKPGPALDSPFQPVVVDFEQLAAWPHPVDHVYCCLGTTIKKAGSQAAFRKVDYDYCVALGQVAAQFGARMALVSSVGADPRSSNFYLRTKGETEQALIGLGLKQLVLCQPSLMFEGRAESRAGERLAGAALTVLKPILCGPLRKYRATHPQKVARAMVQQLLEELDGLQVLTSEQIATY